MKNMLWTGTAGQPAAQSESGAETAALPQSTLPAEDTSPEPGGGDARPGRQRPARASAELPEPRKRAKTRTAPGIGASQLEQELSSDSAQNGRSGAQQAPDRSSTPSSQKGTHLHGSSSSGPAFRPLQTAAAHDQTALDGHIATADGMRPHGGQQSRLGPHLYLAQATISHSNRFTDKAPGLSGLWQDFSVPWALEAVQVSQTNLWMSLRWEAETLREH